MSYDTGRDKEKERMKKKVVALEKAFGAMTNKPPPICGWIVVSEIRLIGPFTPSMYVELETRSTKVKTETQPAQIGGNTVAWTGELAVWVDSQAEELMYLFVRSRRMIGTDDVVGKPVQIDLKRVPTNSTVMQQVDNGANSIQLLLQMRPANARQKPTIPKGCLCETVGDFNVPDAKARLKKGGINDYCEFIPTVGRRLEHGGMNDYGDFIVPPNGKAFRMKRGGLNDYSDFVLPKNYRQAHGGINDYYTV